MANWRSYINPSVGDGQTTLDGIIADGPTYGIQISDDLNVTGLSTFSDIARFSGTVRIDGELRDGDNSFGTSGQVLSSDGTDTAWVNAGSLTAGAASEVGVTAVNTDSDHFITFVDSSSGNENIKVDTDLKYNPSSNTIATIKINDLQLVGQLKDGDNAFGSSGQVLSSDGTDTRWINAASLSAGAASQIAINSDTNNAERFITFVNSSSGNNNLNTNTQLKYNPSTNQLNFTSTESGIKFGPGDAANDDAHIEWLGGSNAGYLRISTSDDGGSEEIQFGDYASQNKVGTFTEWLSIRRSIGTFTGTFSATTFSGSGASLTTLNASNLSSGTIPNGRFPATLPAASGTNLTALNASNLSSGTVNTARLPNTYTKAGQVIVQSTGAGNDVRLDAADHIILESGEEEDGAIYFRANSGTDSYRFAKSGQTAIEGFLSFQSLDADRTFTFPNVTGTIALTSSDITGNSATATNLATSRNFSITGEITANAVSFNGGSNVALNATVDNNIIDEANLKVSNNPTNGYFLQAQSGNTGGLTWAEVTVPAANTLSGSTLASGITASSITSLGTLSSLHVSGTTNLDSGADIDGGQVNIRYDHASTPALYVRNNTSYNQIIARFVGNSASLDIENISSGDYFFGHPTQHNGFQFFDTTGGVDIVYNNVVSVEFDSGNNFGDFKGVPSVNNVDLARVSDNITGTSGGFTAGNASNLNSGTIPAARLPNHSASLLTSGTIPAARVPTLNQNTTGSAAKLTTARNIAGTSFNGTTNININYNNLTNKPTIPTNNNQLSNGAGYITGTDIRSMNEAASTGQSSTTSGQYQNKVSVSINTTSTSRVLVHFGFSHEHSDDDNNQSVTTQIVATNGSFVGGTRQLSNSGDYERQEGTLLDIGSHSGTRTYTIQFRSSNSTSRIKDAYLCVIEMTV